MLIVALFTIAKRWKQPKCPSRDGSINIMRSIHTTEYYSVLKTQEILTQATPWMNLSKRSQSHTHIQNTIWFHLHEVPRVVKFIETEGRSVVARRWGQETGS